MRKNEEFYSSATDLPVDNIFALFELQANKNRNGHIEIRFSENETTFEFTFYEAVPKDNILIVSQNFINEIYEKVMNAKK